MAGSLDSATLDWVANFTRIPRTSLGQGTSQANASAPGGPPPGGGSAAPGGAGELTLGPARITEEELGPSVGPGPGADTLYAFMAEDGSGPVDQKASPTAAALNESGRPLQAEVAATLKHFMTWKHAVAVIQEDQKKGKGQAALKSVKDAAGAIGKNSRGSGGSGLREGTEKFFDLVKDAGMVVDEVTGQVAKVSASDHDFTALLWDSKANEQATEVDNAKDAVAEEKERLKEQKEEIASYFALAEKLLKPQEWSEAILTVTLFADEKLTGAIVASTDKLEKLKSHLEEAKQKLSAFQNSALAERMLGQQKRAEAEMHALDEVWKKFDKLGKDVKAAQTTVVEALGNSDATKPAAQAVKQRDAINKQATNAAGMVRGYLAEAEPVLKNVQHLVERYRSYVSIVKQYGKGSPEYMDSLSKTAKRNTDTCQGFADYIQATQAQAKEALDYLTKDTGSTFLAGYNEIPDALEDAVIGRNT